MSNTLMKLKNAVPLEWINTHLEACPRSGSDRSAAGRLKADSSVPAGQTAYNRLFPVSADQITEAEARLARFAPFFAARFPETAPQNGLIESPLVEIPAMKAALENEYRMSLPGSLYLKRDDLLAVAGSIKARGGIYEVLAAAERILIEGGKLKPAAGCPTGDYSMLCQSEFRDFLSRFTIEVGSTGNLGLSIGMIGTALGFNVTVHMSADARQWKKDLLRKNNVCVKEYDGDYSEAVASGRKSCEGDPRRHFIDDEHSLDLFLGYATAVRRLVPQLKSAGIIVDEAHPLFVTIPCGVGGAPGGIMYALRQTFGGSVHVFFAEPVQAPSMLLGLVSGQYDGICVNDIGLSGKTEADGLACGRPSGFVCRLAASLLSGGMTVEDRDLFRYLRLLHDSENIFIEPSSCAAFACPARFMESPVFQYYVNLHTLGDKLAASTHIVWSTGGGLVPEPVRAAYLSHRI